MPHFRVCLAAMGLLVFVADACVITVTERDGTERAGGGKGGSGPPVAPRETGGTAGPPKAVGGNVGTGGLITKAPERCIAEPGSDSCMPVCNVESHLAERTPPQILIVLDRSMSMESPPNVGCRTGCASKWSLVTSAIVDVVSATDQAVNWGVKYFGSDSTCGVSAGAEVPLAAGNGPRIRASIAATSPLSMTPTRAAVRSAVDYLETIPEPQGKFIVLATDGQPNCGSGNGTVNDDAGAEAAVQQARDRGIFTFVVGIATSGTSAEATLNRMAENGGMPHAGATKYFPVASSAELKSALTMITGKVASCTYPLSPPSSLNDPSKLTVHLGAKTVPHDPDNGWEYATSDRNAVTLFGAACDALRDSPSALLEVFYGCPDQPPVP